MKNIFKSIFIISILVIDTYAYNATCKLHNGKNFIINVHKRVMTVDSRWKVFYKEKTWTGWYVYENKGYKYTVGAFNDGKFPIEVTNKYEDELSTGMCFLK